MRSPSRILLVEDVEDIRNATLETLSRAGYDVLEAANAEALALMARGPAPDLLFTDILLGRGLNGYELAGRALLLRPRLLVLYTSGDAGRPRNKDAAPPGKLLMKPYRALQLLREVALLLGRPPQAGPRPAPGALPEDRRASILVVEDDDRSRAIAVDLFKALGLRVYDAWNGRDALLLLEQHPQIVALFADVRLPGMNGVELAEAAQRLRPDLMIVLTSAFLEQTPLAGLTFVPKPWQPRDFDAIAGTITRH